MIEIDFESWSRRAEVVNYAAAHCVDIAKAIEMLVNSGLSHERRSWI